MQTGRQYPPSAVAGDRVNPVHTDPAVVTGSGQAVVNVSLTQAALEARGTGTGECVDAVDTLRAVLTRVRGTLVYVSLTHVSCPPRGTGTGVAVELVVGGGG